MPVKWTPDNDQLLLIKILETHDLQVNTKKIADAWPAEKGEAPTARAIQERLVRIRQNAKINGSTHFGISSAQSKSVGTPRSSPPKTPSTSARKSKPTSTAPSTESSASKRKRDSTAESTPRVKNEDADDDVMLISYGPVSPTPVRSFTQKTAPAANSSRSSFNNGVGSTDYFPGSFNAGGDDGDTSPSKYMRTGYDGANDFYASFEDEVAV